MRKLALPLVAAAWLLGGGPASAQMIGITASLPSKTATVGGTFNVSLALNVPAGAGPSDVSAFDLYLVTAAANSGFFSITAANPGSAFNTFGPDDSGGDPLNHAAASGYVQNGIDQGFSGSAQTVPISNLPLETLTFTVAANTPASTYTFQTTTMATAGVFYSDVSDSSGNVYEVTSPGTFAITVVPEPSTLAALGIGLLGWRMASVIRRRRVIE